MSLESLFKIGLPAFPLGFTILGAWLYWGDNPLALLPPPLAFWAGRNFLNLFASICSEPADPLVLTIFASVLWLVASITAHNLSRFLSASQHIQFATLMGRTYFLYAYISAGFGCTVAGWNFLRYEPAIVNKSRRDRGAAIIEEQQP